MERQLDIAAYGKDIEFRAGMPIHIRVGALDLWLEKRDLLDKGDSWYIASKHDLIHEDLPDPNVCQQKPDDVPWNRWIVGDIDDVLRVRLMMPDAPVVARPESPVYVQPGQSTVFYLGIPLWLQLSVGKGAQVLCELPTVRLNKSWFGTPVKGELTYAMRTWARQDPSELLPRIHRAVCTVQVRNLSSESLDLARMCVRCQHLRLYRGKTRFWSNVVRLTHRGDDATNRVVYAPSAPAQDNADELFAPAREEVNRGFLQQSFQRLQNKTSP